MPRLKQTTNSRTIIDPVLNELVYTVLYNATYAEKRQLKGKYHAAAMTAKAARSFVEFSNDEEKKIILSHFGYRFFYGFVKEDLKSREFVELLKRYDDDREGSILKEILDKGIFISSDREFNRYLTLYSSAIHRKEFFLDMELKRVGYHIGNWKRRLILQRDMLVRELDESAVELSKFLFASFMLMDDVKAKMGVSDIQMKILLRLYREQHIYLSEKYLASIFQVPTVVKKHLRALRAAGYILKETKNKEDLFMITGKGINVVSNFFKTIFEDKKL